MPSLGGAASEGAKPDLGSAQEAQIVLFQAGPALFDGLNLDVSAPIGQIRRPNPLLMKSNPFEPIATKL